MSVSSPLMMMLKMDTNSSYNSDPFSLASVSENIDVDHHHQKNSLGFMELLGFQDYYFDSTTPFLPPMEMEMGMGIPTSDHHLLNQDHDDDDGVCNNGHDDDHDQESSVVLNGGQPSSPNSSSISTSTAHQQPLKQCIIEKKAMNGDEKKAMKGDDTKAKKKTKAKAPRFAFLTRTEIDHLDDGYRWRKYGQKAVKNSHFPRSYYRCTSASCSVKKRVERCMDDSSYVITTYEGQHNHPVASNSTPLIPTFNHLLTAPAASAAFTTSTAATMPQVMLKLDQGGLLQDMLHCHH